MPDKPTLLPLSLERIHLVINQQTLLQALSCRFNPGTITIVLGANGAGKTLLLKICHGLLTPTSGRVHWNETDKKRLRQRQAMVFQRPVLLQRSVAANIDYALKLQGLDKKQRAVRVQHSLRLAGLHHRQHQPAQVLSGGEQQRLALARAWALRPEVLFLDEPTANTDPSATAAIETLIKTFADQGVKIIMTTHDLHQAKRLAQDVIFLHQGRLLEQSRAEPFFVQPQTQIARAFIQGELLW